MTAKKPTLPLCTVYLQSPVDAFTAGPRHIEALSSIFSGHTIFNARTEKEYTTHLPTTRTAITWKFKKEWYAQAPLLKEIYTPAAGKDWIASPPDSTISTHHGTFHGPLMREALLYLMLYFSRNMKAPLTAQQKKKWDRNSLSTGTSLRGSRVLIIGYGTIGRSCASLLSAAGCIITGVKRSIPLQHDPHVEKIIRWKDAGDDLANADHIILLLPATPETDNMITARHFSIMKNTAYLYNLGRGNCCREDDLIKALDTGEIAGAGLDVFAQEPLPAESPLWKKENVLILPHASAICTGYMDAYIEELKNNLTF